MKYIDRFLDSITMYRLLSYGLLGILAAGLLFAYTGRLAFTPFELLLSTVVIMGVLIAADVVFSRLFHVARNLESGLITGFILVLILQPATNSSEYMLLGLAGLLASSSKYLLAYRGKHIFNPAALAAAILSLSTLYTTAWWVGNSAMWPVTLVIGLLVVRKIRRFSLVLTFVGVTVALQLAMFIIGGKPVVSGIQYVLLSSPLIFLATIMLTEPATMPPRRRQQMIFAAGVAVLYVTAWHIGSLYVYPTVALLLGNLYAYVVSPKYRLRLKLLEIQQISDRVYNYVFQPDRPVQFRPGQYMEWTLAGVPYDSRGNRRTFTIASSPTEQTIQLGLKYYQPASAYKLTFNKLRPGDMIHAGQIAGDFTLGGAAQRKLVFIAGGIGITPFRSMIKYLDDTNTSADIVLVYAVSDARELAYAREFRAASRVGVRYLPVITRDTPLSAELIRRAVPDYAERMFYVSGSHDMVENTGSYLRHLGVSGSMIKTDHFSGY